MSPPEGGGGGELTGGGGGGGKFDEARGRRIIEDLEELGGLKGIAGGDAGSWLAAKGCDWYELGPPGERAATLNMATPIASMPLSSAVGIFTSSCATYLWLELSNGGALKDWGMGVGKDIWEGGLGGLVGLADVVGEYTSEDWPRG